jgi:hypothetical protein
MTFNQYRMYKKRYLELKYLIGGDCKAEPSDVKNNFANIKKLDQINIIIGAGNKDKSDIERLSSTYNVFVSNDVSIIDIKTNKPPYGLCLDINDYMDMLRYERLIGPNVNRIVFDYSVSKFIFDNYWILGFAKSLRVGGKLFIDQIPYDRQLIDSVKYNEIKQILKVGKKFYVGFTKSRPDINDIKDMEIITHNENILKELLGADYEIKLKTGQYPIPLYKDEQWNEQIKNAMYFEITRIK